MKKDAVDWQSPFQIVLDSEEHGKSVLILTDVIQFIDVMHKISTKLRSLKEEKREKSVRIIQRRWRTYQAHKHFHQLRQATVTLQSYVRRYLVQKHHARPNPSDRRESILKELETTEESYVTSLQLLIRLYLKPLRSLSQQKKGAGSSMATSIEVIFQHLETLHEIHDAFLFFWKNKRRSPGQLLLEFIQGGQLEVYDAYCRNYEKSRTELERCMKTKWFSTFIEVSSIEIR
ncbi:hypothetical protein HMI55_004596 [Coelomomyces lativittatus]|nr:hypothetical protein HMI56_004937 [Coelomomyces lativittatus]KAJ1499064.1 hypothetical protein HMI55_004596 [Coelomomyces lativittatus]